MATMRANKSPDGYLFAIVNSLDTVVQLGVKVSSLNHNSLNISLVYNNPSTQTPSESLVSFTLPYEPKLWINFAMQVMNDQVIIYHNCLKVQEINVTKEPKELIFESASTFYLAQAGNSGGPKHKFEVSYNSLSLFYWNLSTKILSVFIPTCHQSIPNIQHLFTRQTKQFPGLIVTHAHNLPLSLKLS